MAADALEHGRVDAVGPREAVEVVAQLRPLRRPASDAEVRMIALREHPAVAARHDPQLDPCRLLVRRPFEAAPGNVPLECDATDDAAPEPGRLRNDAVGSVGSDEKRRTNGRLPHTSRYAFVVELEVCDGTAVAECR